MSIEALLVLFIGILFVFFFTGFPVGYAIGLTSIALMLLGIGIDVSPTMMAVRMFRGLNSFTLLVVPFFFLAGKLMNQGGMTKTIFDFADTVVGRVRGGLCYVNVIASMIFAGMSGVALADAAGLGAIEHRSMIEKGYPNDISLGITAASTLIGPIIPPSLPLVLYALLANTSTGAILVAGLVPGVLIGLFLMVAVAFIAKKRKLPYGSKFSWGLFAKRLKSGGPALLVPVILLGGIMSGYFTVTEAAALAVLYATIIMFVFYKELTWPKFWDVVKESAVDAGTALIMVGFAMIYSFLAIRTRLPFALADAISYITTDPFLAILVVNVFLLILGMFLPTMAALPMLVPILVPALAALGVHPLHFGVVMVFNLMIGLLTPPYGMVLFVLSKVTNTEIEDAVKAILPFYFPLLACLFVLSYFPGLVLWLPRLVNLAS